MQDVKQTFSGLSYLRYCSNLVNFHQILSWLMSRLGSPDLKWPPVRHLYGKKHRLYVWGIYINFVCSIIIISFRKLYTYVLWYWHTWLGRSRPPWEIKPLLFSHFPNIFSVNMLLKMGKIHNLYSILETDFKRY